MTNQKEGYSFEVDIWSLGIIIYTLIIGKTPYEVKNENIDDDISFDSDNFILYFPKNAK